MVGVVSKGVHWNGINPNSQKTMQNEVISRKRIATRDQPTWSNCKLKRPSQNRSRKSTLPEYVVNTLAYERIPEDMVSVTNTTRNVYSPKSSRQSARSSTSRISQTRTMTSIYSESSISELRRIGSASTDDKRRESGRDILMRRAREMLPHSEKNPSTRSEESSSYSKNRIRMDTSHPFRKFRISSAESAHQSPDISIGLRHISRMLHCSSSGPEVKKHSHKQRSVSALDALVNITADNLQRTRRQSEPIISLSSPRSQDWESLAPGESATNQRRGSTTSTPATKGAGSLSYYHQSSRKQAKPRPLPEVCMALPFSDREWRPPNLQKYSVKEPWAPRLQTTRYFPKFSNLQDVHCRNPYVVPGSILYKPLPSDP